MPSNERKREKGKKLSENVCSELKKKNDEPAQPINSYSDSDKDNSTRKHEEFPYPREGGK